MPEWLVTVLEEEAARYQLQYINAIAREAGRHKRVIPEVLLEMAKGGHHAPYCYYRVDLGVSDGDEVTFIELNAELGETRQPAIAEQLAGTRLRVNPFVWIDVEIRGDFDLTSDAALAEWTYRWLDVGDSRTLDPSHTSSVIHSVNPSLRIPFGGSIVVDFGSAPARAAVELLELLLRRNPDFIQIGAPQR